MSKTKISEKPLLEVMKGRRVDPVPVWMMRQAGRYLPEYRELRRTAENFLQFCFTPELAVEVTLQPLRRFDFDAAILFADILVIPHAFGQAVAFKAGEGPVLDPIRSEKDLSRLSTTLDHEALAPVYETVRILAKEIPPRTTLIGFAGAPWTVASYMIEGGSSRDFSHIRRWAYDAPDSFKMFMNRLSDATAGYLKEQIVSGAEVIQLFDTWAGVLPPAEFEKWVISPTARIVKAIRESHPDVPIVGFPRGSGLLTQRFIEETGVDVIGLDHTMPLDHAAETLQRQCVVQGNLDNQLLVTGGKAMDEQVQKILTNLAGGPHVFNLGHGIVPDTPPEHVGRVIELIRGG